jgi:hypothetical protein
MDYLRKKVGLLYREEGLIYVKEGLRFRHKPYIYLYSPEEGELI